MIVTTLEVEKHVRDHYNSQYLRWALEEELKSARERGEGDYCSNIKGKDHG